jgi:hypothetical protein
MPATHKESVYCCPGCLTTMLGRELDEQRRTYSMRRRTFCCNETPVLMSELTLLLSPAALSRVVG